MDYHTTSKSKMSSLNRSLEGLKVVNVRELSQSPAKKLDFPSPPLPEAEVEEENLEWLRQRPVRS